MGWRIRFTIGDLTRQNIILDRGGRVVALGIEELDLLPRFWWKIGAKFRARFEQPALRHIVDNVQPVSRRDQFEG